MSLEPGSRVGPYEIEGPLGAGGMGEVYRARDGRLDRAVAIKSLPAAFLGDPERRARFEREARLLASLNHPNIATIHGLEETNGMIHLVLEFIDGETLSSRLSRGALTVRETLDLGGQVAAAIEAAHEKGIVHRDLKPANIMLTAGNRAKVLDFGLARGVADGPRSQADLTASPTLALSATAAGVILGTAPYMSPEQARGQEVDRRTDIWALGCLLFECLTGRPTFAGETVSDVIARILEREPDWSLLPPAVPQRLRDLIKRCLTKEAAERPRDVGDIRRELGAITTEITSGSGIRMPNETPSLAVLYFENLSSDSESDYFCAGITEDILTDLSKIKGIKVASRNAVARYRGQTVDIAKVGSELGVRAVLEGSVRKAGDRVRISAQLINAADGFHLWAERYDRQMADVFEVQEEIASSIAQALRGALTPAEVEAIGKDKPNDAQAYDLYLKGRARYGNYSDASLREALALFQQAIALDPNYALAWAGAADCYAQLFGYEYVTDASESLDLALEAAKKAIALDPKLAEGHKALALALRYSGDIPGSEASSRRAIEANPRYFPAIINTGVGLFDRGDVAGAERHYRRAIEIDPQECFAMIWLSFVLGHTGREAEALEWLARVRRTSDSPFYVMAVGLTRVSYALRRGDLPAAETALVETEAAGCDPVNLKAMKVWYTVVSGDMEKAGRLAAELGTLPALNLVTTSSLAAAYVALGEWDRALRVMSKPVSRSEMPVLIRLLPELQRLADREPFAPRRSSLTLVWPLEAPMLPPGVHALFKETKIESGRPEASAAGVGSTKSSGA